MTSRTLTSAAWLLAATVWVCAPGGALAQGKWDQADKAGGAKAAGKGKAEGGAPDKAGAKADAASAKAKLYRLKEQKKAKAGGGESMVLVVEDVFTGKTEQLHVANNDPAKKEYDPLTAVADAVKDLAPGAAIEVGTEKQKGRTMVTSVAKADVKPGEELPNGFVFVESKEDKGNGKGGAPTLVVTLSKFGREVKVGVPMRKDKDNKDAEYAPDPKLDYVITRLQAGAVVEAVVKRAGGGGGSLPVLAEIYEYRPPERGTFLGMKQVEFNSWPAAGFEVKAQDGTTITFTLEGTEQSRNGQKLYAPDPQKLKAVQKLKPETPVEVRYRLDGRSWMMRDIRMLAPDEKPAKSEKASKPEKMDGDKAKEDAAKPDAAGDDGKMEKPAGDAAPEDAPEARKSKGKAAPAKG